MDVAGRLARRLVETGTGLDRPALTRAAKALLAEEAPLAGDEAVTRAVDEVIGLGPLEDLLRDSLVSDVLVNGDGAVWIERAGALERTGLTMAADAVQRAAERVITPLGLRLDRSSPSVDARLPDGSRLHAAIPPVSVEGPVLAVRRFTEVVSDLDALVDIGGVDDAGRALLEAVVASRRNLVISGSTGSGKTTLLNVLLKEVPAAERVISIEDSAELAPGPHLVRLEARPANSEGRGEITMSRLVRQALRLRPDRIVVGEVRGPEAADMLHAMSTGHDGSMSTVHAGSPEEALWRLASLAGSADGPRHRSIDAQMRAVIDTVVQVERRGRVRRVAGIYSIGADRIVSEYRCAAR